MMGAHQQRTFRAAFEDILDDAVMRLSGFVAQRRNVQNVAEAFYQRRFAGAAKGLTWRAQR